VLFGLDLALLAYVSLATVLLVLGVLKVPGGAPAAPTPADVLANALLVFALMGVIPFAWVLATRLPPLVGTVAFLRLHDPVRSILKGVGVGALALVALFALALVLQALGDVPKNPVADQLIEAIDLRLALLVSLTAAVGEEIFFRGILQRWVGVWGQAALFALAHLSYGTVLQLVGPGVLGLVLGLLLKRGQSLWLCIAAHFTFDFAQLALGLLQKGHA
jgi:membrane protease YdiL (CAAX protease family)